MGGNGDGGGEGGGVAGGGGVDGRGGGGDGGDEGGCRQQPPGSYPLPLSKQDCAQKRIALQCASLAHLSVCAYVHVAHVLPVLCMYGCMGASSHTTHGGGAAGGDPGGGAIGDGDGGGVGGGDGGCLQQPPAS